MGEVDEERLRIRSKAVAMVREINLIEADAKRWDATHPDEPPLQWDPMGEMATIRGVLQNFLRAEEPDDPTPGAKEGA